MKLKGELISEIDADSEVDIEFEEFELEEIDPDLLEEGVSIMKEMLKPAIENKAKLRQVGFSSEMDTIKVIQEIHNRALLSNWTPGTPSMTEEDHLQVIRDLRVKQEISLVQSQVAATIDS